MATKILDLELTQLPFEITGLEEYPKAFILVRLNGRPIGRLYIPLIKGFLNNEIILNSLIDEDRSHIKQCIVDDLFHYDDDAYFPSQNLSATVAICTHDRTEELKLCLEGLMRMPDDGQEILVIDNHPSNQKTYRLLKKFKSIRYIQHDRIGLNSARNRAIKEALHPIVAFIDDDAIPDTYWLRSILRNFNDELVACVTGLTLPRELTTKAQEWFEHHYSFSKGFKKTTYEGTTFPPVAAVMAGSGVNMALRKKTLEEIGVFDEALGCGTRTQSGGDTEMFIRIIAKGFRIIYDPAVLNWHRHRCTWDELKQTHYKYSVGGYAAWTRSLLVGKQLSAFGAALRWLILAIIPNLLNYLIKRSKTPPFNYALIELLGSLYGPLAYLQSKKHYCKGRKNI